MSNNRIALNLNLKKRGKCEYCNRIFFADQLVDHKNKKVCSECYTRLNKPKKPVQRTVSNSNVSNDVFLNDMKRKIEELEAKVLSLTNLSITYKEWDTEQIKKELLQKYDLQKFVDVKPNVFRTCNNFKRIPEIMNDPIKKEVAYVISRLGKGGNDYKKIYQKVLELRQMQSN